MTENLEQRIDGKCTTANKRFGASGGVTSNDRLWVIDRLWF